MMFSVVRGYTNKKEIVNQGKLECEKVGLTYFEMHDTYKDGITSIALCITGDEYLKLITFKHH